MENPFCVAAAALARKRKRGDEECDFEDRFEDGVVSQEEEVVALFRDAEDRLDRFA